MIALHHIVSSFASYHLHNNKKEQQKKEQNEEAGSFDRHLYFFANSVMFRFFGRQEDRSIHSVSTISCQ